MSLKILIPFVLFFIYRRTVHLINALKSKNKDSIKFEVFLFNIVFLTGSLLIYFAISRIE